MIVLMRYSGLKYFSSCLVLLGNYIVMWKVHSLIMLLNVTPTLAAVSVGVKKFEFYDSFIPFIHIQCLISVSTVVDLEHVLGELCLYWRIHLYWDTSSSHGTMHPHSYLQLSLCSSPTYMSWRNSANCGDKLTKMQGEHAKLYMERRVIQAWDRTWA